MATIGIMHSGYENSHTAVINVFNAELLRLLPGVIINKTLWSNDDPVLLANNAKTLATNTSLNLIVAAGGSASVYAVRDAQNRAGTHTSVVFTTFSLMVSPANNMCGVCAHTSDADLTRMKKLHTRVGATRYGILDNQFRTDYDATKFNSFAPGVTLDLQHMKNHPTDTETQALQNITNAFARWRGMGITAALVCADPFFHDHRQEIGAAAKPAGGGHIRTMHQWHDFVTEGHGDFAYGTPISEPYLLAAAAAARVLNGATPVREGVISLPNLRDRP